MVHFPRFLTPALAVVLVAAITPAAQAQFFFFGDPPQRKPPARQAPAREAPAREAAAPLPAQAFVPASYAEKASFNDTARFLAGLPPVESGAFDQVTRDQSWQNHAASFNKSWGQLEAQRLSKIRAWSASNIKGRAGMPMYYMFSGPDFLYANAFYPDASTYILSGLEPVGRIPVINDYTRRALGNLRSSMASSISLSFFITKNMKHQLRETALSGTLPILMVYIARAGKTIDDINLVTLSPDGIVTPVEAGAPQRGVQGARITFHSPGKPKQTLYYFSTDVSDGGVKNSGFLKFVDSFGRGDALFKAASYLPHSGGFSQVRDFIVSCKTIPEFRWSISNRTSGRCIRSAVTLGRSRSSRAVIKISSPKSIAADPTSRSTGAWAIAGGTTNPTFCSRSARISAHASNCVRRSRKRQRLRRNRSKPRRRPLRLLQTMQRP
jgi:hypothetical protein